ECPIGHIDDRVNDSAEAVKALQESRLVGQVVLDRLPDACIKKLGMRSRVEEAVEIRGVVEDGDIVRVGRLPLNDWQKPPRIASQSHAVFIDSRKDRRGYGKVNPLGAVAAPREDVMDEVAMDAPVAVLKRMNIDESESEDGGSNDGVEAVFDAAVESDHSFHKR